MRKVAPKNEINERKLSLEDRLLFHQAKVKELKSFFDNGVWTFQTTKEADPARTLTSRILLKWSKNADGTPRAKARLVVRGYADADALAGELDTASPASTRLGRACLLSISAILGWCGWSADVSTAFLQGLPQERRLWVKLPADALRILGGDADTRMFLYKPVYGQLDAPKRWFLEATRRLRQLQWVPHPMDPCFWLLYEPDEAGGSATKLCGLLCLHVDDMLGCGDTKSETYLNAEKQLKESFNFRTWQKDEPFEYCGAKMTRDSDGTWHVSHDEYLRKVQPIPVERGRQSHQPMSDKEQTMLRGLLGSLQWPAIQSSPHIQASTSLLSGEMSTGLSAPLLEANKLLKFSKANSDVHLKFNPLGELKDLRLSCMFDAALGVHHDGSSQGGFIVLLTHKDAFDGVECPYHVLDWKSFRLPRVARSSLAAEVQSAAQAVDTTEFVVRFWHLIFNPYDSIRETLDVKNPTLAPIFVTDAKALFDSFHRDAINHGATDKRTNLELRVIREQVECIGGTLKWISSERQFGDGLTKMSARQLLADRLRHGSIKYTWDPTYQASKKKSAQERAESRNQFSKQLNNTNSQHNTTTTHAVNVGAKNSTFEKITEELDMTENLEPHVEAFETEPTEAFVNDQHSQNDTAFEENFDHENFQAPVETYASHGGGSLLLRYVLLVTMVQSTAASDLFSGNQCSLEDAPIEFSETDDIYLFLAFGVFLLCTFGFGLICVFARLLKELVASRRDGHAQLRVDHAEQQAENIQLQQRVIDINAQITDQQTEIRRLRAELIAAQGRLVDQQFVIDDHAAIREQERTQDQRSIRTAVGLLDRILDETRNLNQVRIYFAVTGRCWHRRHDCNGLKNANQVEERYACSFCLASLPPYEVHPDTGTTFWQDCEEYLRQHGGRLNYVQTVIH